MQKLARIEPTSKLEPVSVRALVCAYSWLIRMTCRTKLNIQAMESRCILLKNMFNPEEYAALPYVIISLNLIVLQGDGRRLGQGTR
jgi:hypothetical protein